MASRIEGLKAGVWQRFRLWPLALAVTAYTIYLVLGRHTDRLWVWTNVLALGVVVAMVWKTNALHETRGWSKTEAFAVLIGSLVLTGVLAFPLAGAVFGWVIGDSEGHTHIGLEFVITWVGVCLMLWLTVMLVWPTPRNSHSRDAFRHHTSPDTR